MCLYHCRYRKLFHNICKDKVNRRLGQIAGLGLINKNYGMTYEAEGLSMLEV